MLKTMFVLFVFIASTTFSGFLFAKSDNESADDGDRIDLFQIRDVILKSFSLSDVESASFSVSVEAELFENEILIGVEGFEGIMNVDIISLSGTGNVNESFYINGLGVHGVDISPLSSGDYKIELNLGSTAYIGKFSIKK